MTAVGLIVQLSSLGVELWVEDGTLKFRAPSGVLSDSLKAQLRAQKAPLLALLGADPPHDEESAFPPRAPRGAELLPLSFAQERLWFLNQLEPNSATYNVPIALRLLGRLDVGALNLVLAALVRRHEVLRTRFIVHQGEPRQEILDELSTALRVVEAQGDGAREAEVRRFAAEEAARPFDLTVTSWRATLLRLSDQEHVLFFTMHHIITDGWSIGVLVHELGTLYSAFSRGQSPPLPPLPIQYADFAVWQRNRLTGALLDTPMRYWKDELSGAPPILELPTDRPRPPVQTFRGAAQSITLPKPLVTALVGLSRGESTTLFMTMLAALQVLLWRYTGQDDIVVGSPIAGRTQAELEPLIGLFINMLPLRTRLSRDLTFRQLLERVRHTTLRAYEHQEVPFQKLVEEVSPDFDRSRSPIFQVVFALHNAPMPELRLPELAIHVEPAEGATAKYDLAFSLTETDTGIEGTLEYGADLFDAPTIERLWKHYETLLEAVANDPDRRIAELPLLTAAERKQRLRTSNETSLRGLRADACVHELFEAQAAKTPDAVALVFGHERVTYERLNRRANHLAHHLQSLGVGPDVRVGICTARSIDMVVGLLAILKAGGAYVPLDPTYPDKRLAFMLEDSDTFVLLTQTHLVEGSLRPVLEAGSRRHIVRIDEYTAEPRDEESCNPPRRACGDNLAYVIYTSGSTGTPKGVENRHRGLTNLVSWFVSEYDVGGADRIAQQAAMGFDACGLELWPALAAGASLYILDEETRLSVPLLVQYFERERMTIAHLSPALAEPFVDGELPELALRALLTGSDKVQRSPRRAPPFRFTNHYGPTETSILATWGPIRASQSAEPPPIGLPLPGVRVYLLDPNLQWVPPGVVGELYVGGMGVGRGYARRPALTAERFLPDPFEESPGARMYRTGDRARARPDGVIEFMGRADQQVKIRGFRIEIGEIESALLEYPGIGETAVVVREETPGDKRLVAYIVPSGDLPARALREHLQERLPAFMIPSSFMMLEALPMTANGKVDRKALGTQPFASAALPSNVEDYVAPRDRAEADLAAVWSELLKVERVGIHDDFFALGGHSLLAVRMVAEIQRTFDREIPLATVYDRPVLASLAAVLRGGEGLAPDMAPRGALAEMRADCMLADDVRPAHGLEVSASPPNRILLTGVTGFLGAFLLRELLVRTHAEIFCLVRATDAQDAMHRVRGSLAQYDLWRDDLAPRIIPVRGDLARASLDLSSDDRRRLASTIDAIYHNGALVSQIAPYRALRPVNVLATDELLRLACDTRLKTVHFISTMAVTEAAIAGPSVIDEGVPLAASRLTSGYNQSKWVGEQLMMRAAARDIPTAIYRPGRIVADSQTGRGNADDFVSRILRACIELRAVSDAELSMMTPVDYVSRAIVDLSLRPESRGGVFHIANTARVGPDAIVLAARELGYNLECMPETQIMSRLTRAAEKPDHPLAPFLEQLRSSGPSSDGPPGDTMRPIADTQTQRILAGRISCPPVDARAIASYLRYLSSIEKP